VDGPVLTLGGDLHHFTCDSLAEHFRTMDRYTTLAAQEAYANGGLPRGPGILPRAVAMTVAAPPWKFIETYVLRQGFRDGFPGLIIAGLAGVYVFSKYAKLCEMLRDRHRSEP
jgi:hypothetical protein